MRFSFSGIIRAVRSYFYPVRSSTYSGVPEVLRPVVEAPEAPESVPVEEVLPVHRSPVFQASDKRAVIRKPSNRRKRRR